MLTVPDPVNVVSRPLAGVEIELPPATELIEFTELYRAIFLFNSWDICLLQLEYVRPCLQEMHQRETMHQVDLVLLDIL